MTPTTKLRLRFFSILSGGVLAGGALPLGCSSTQVGREDTELSRGGSTGEGPAPDGGTSETTQAALLPSCAGAQVVCFAPNSTHFNSGNVPDPPPEPTPHFDENSCQIPSEVRDGCCNPARTGPGFVDGRCCYGFCAGACCGRPLTVGGTARVAATESRTDWAAHLNVDLSDLDPATRERLAAEWTKDAQMEHASVASFARFILDLVAFGAPADLVDCAQRALADEVRHARVCFALASAYAGAPLGPGALDVEGVRPCSDLANAAALAVREGCVNETIAALTAMEQAREAADPAVRAVLEGIARDETEHAELAWRFVQWAMSVGGDEVARAVRGALRHETSFAVIERRESKLRDQGRLTTSEQSAIEMAAWSDVIEPCARLLAV